MDRHRTQVTKPTMTGNRSVARAPLWSEIAKPARTAIAANNATGCHHDRRASRPAQANSRASTTRSTTTRKGLSLVPRMLMARSTTGPGVRRMTISATATTGDSRIVITIATK